MSEPTIIGPALLDQIWRQARESQRKRKNFNFHLRESDPANRLLNAVEPESYVRPHRHLDPSKDETIIAVRGSFGVVFFDDSGAVTKSLVIRAGGETMGVNIPHGIYHTLVALDSASVFFEAKAGPYVPVSMAEFAAWAPAEGDLAALGYLEKLRGLFDFQLAD
ncbi:MAG TPA: WbuC family cupin fold metalloprotein [Burkholderiales bacterium]|nr:WbuC family cupin fold metalloprotein [Burkholderiales bacterium]